MREREEKRIAHYPAFGFSYSERSWEDGVVSEFRRLPVAKGAKQRRMNANRQGENAASRFSASTSRRLLYSPSALSDGEKKKKKYHEKKKKAEKRLLRDYRLSHGRRRKPKCCLCRKDCRLEAASTKPTKPSFSPRPPQSCTVLAQLVSPSIPERTRLAHGVYSAGQKSRS